MACVAPGMPAAEAAFHMDIPGSAPAPDQATGSPVLAEGGLAPAGTPGSAAAGDASGQADLLFVQQASYAQLIFDNPDTEVDKARLVLHNVAPSTTW